MSDQELSQHCDQERLAAIYKKRMDPIVGKLVQYTLIDISDMLAAAFREIANADIDIEREDALIGDIHSTVKEAITNTENALTALRLLNDTLISKGK